LLVGFKATNICILFSSHSEHKIFGTHKTRRSIITLRWWTSEKSIVPIATFLRCIRSFLDSSEGILNISIFIWMIIIRWFVKTSIIIINRFSLFIIIVIIYLILMSESYWILRLSISSACIKFKLVLIFRILFFFIFDLFLRHNFLFSRFLFLATHYIFLLLRYLGVFYNLRTINFWGTLIVFWRSQICRFIALIANVICFKICCSANSIFFWERVFFIVLTFLFNLESLLVITDVFIFVFTGMCFQS